MSALPITVTHQAAAAVLAQIAKRERTTVEAIAERFLVAGLKAERQRIVTERGVETNAIILNTCSEEFLRMIWGDNWEVGWWLASCALPEPTP